MHAFGSPGSGPTWTSSAKDIVGCALGPARLWFTSGSGILNEVYFPRVDIAQIRDLGFIVADDCGFWVEVKRMHSYRTRVPRAGIPALEIVHTHARFALRLRLAPDPDRDVILLEVTLEGDASLRPYALLAPHLGGSGHGNRAADLDAGDSRPGLYAVELPSAALATGDHVDFAIFWTESATWEGHDYRIDVR